MFAVLFLDFVDSTEDDPRFTHGSGLAARAQGLWHCDGREAGEGRSLEGKGQVLTIRAWHQEPEGGHTRTVGCVHGSRWHFEPVPWKYLMYDGFI